MQNSITVTVLGEAFRKLRLGKPKLYHHQALSYSSPFIFTGLFIFLKILAFSIDPVSKISAETTLNQEAWKFRLFPNT